MLNKSRFSRLLAKWIFVLEAERLVNKLLFFSQELNSKTKAIHDKKERPFEGIV
jgi:hypothetical protein